MYIENGFISCGKLNVKLNIQLHVVCKSLLISGNFSNVAECGIKRCQRTLFNHAWYSRETNIVLRCIFSFSLFIPLAKWLIRIHDIYTMLDIICSNIRIKCIKVLIIYLLPTHFWVFLLSEDIVLNNLVVFSVDNNCNNLYILDLYQFFDAQFSIFMVHRTLKNKVILIFNIQITKKYIIFAL